MESQFELPNPNDQTHSISKPPCDKSDEYHLPSVNKHSLTKMEQIVEIVLGTWLTVTLSFVYCMRIISVSRFPLTIKFFSISLTIIPHSYPCTLAIHAP